jgi:hypothetical protein
MSLVDLLTDPAVRRRLSKQLRGSQGPKKRPIGLRHPCQRCGEMFRVPYAVLYSGCQPVICGSCVMDDLDEMTRSRPRISMYSHHDLDMARWSDGDIPQIAVQDGKRFAL